MTFPVHMPLIMHELQLTLEHTKNPQITDPILQLENLKIFGTHVKGVFIQWTGRCRTEVKHSLKLLAWPAFVPFP